MARFDFSPLMRSTIGFDRIADLMEAANLAQGSFPTHNIVQVDDDTYRLELALPAYSQDDLEVVYQPNSLTVKSQGREAEDAEYLHRGISAAPFERRFQLADHITVASAAFDRGLLTVTLARELPEEMQPRTIKISGTRKIGNVCKLEAAA